MEIKSLIEPSTILFKINNKEMIKITEEGFYIENRFVTKDISIYKAFKEWIDDVSNLEHEKL